MFSHIVDLVAEFIRFFSTADFGDAKSVFTSHWSTSYSKSISSQCVHNDRFRALHILLPLDSER